MKKRKELDALVANGKVRKKANGFGSGSGHSSSHELLRVADTDSTDTEDFSGLNTRKSHPKKALSLHRICSACVPLCVFTLVTASIVGLGTLLWLQLGLRGEVDFLRDHLRQVEEGSRGTPLQFHDLHTDMKQLVGNNTALHADIAKLNLTLTAITKGVDDILKRVGQLEQKAGNHTELGRLPDEVKKITEAVASFGSKLLDLETSVTEVKSETSNNQNLKNSLDTLEEDMKSVKLSQANSVTRDQLNQGLLNAFTTTNSTLGAKFHSALEELVDKNTRIAEVQSLVQNLSLRIGALESSSPDQQATVNQVTLEKLNEIVQNRLNVTLSKMTESSVYPIAMTSSNGTVNMKEMSNYVKNLTNLYVALVSKLQKGQETQALSTSVNLDLSANVEDIINGLLSADRQQFKKLQSDFGNLQASFENLKGTTDSSMKKLAEIEVAVGKLSSGNLQTPPGSPNVTTAASASSPQPNNNGSTTTVATTEAQNLVPPKKPTLTGGSLNVEPENKPPITVP